jgi:hypothetical protein
MEWLLIFIVFAALIFGSSRLGVALRVNNVRPAIAYPIIVAYSIFVGAVVWHLTNFITKP